MEYDKLNPFHISLSEISVDDYWDDDNPVSWALSAFMDKGERDRVLLLAECYQRIKDSALNEAKKALLINFTETSYQLTPDEEAQFQRLLEQAEYQEVREMRETFFDKLKQEGREQGVVLGMQKTLSRLLQVKFGTLNQKIIDRVQKIESEEELTSLAEKVITASSLDELGFET